MVLRLKMQYGKNLALVNTHYTVMAEKEAGYMLMKKGGHFTRGKNPEECYIMLFETKRSAIVKEAERIIKSEMGK